MKNCFYILLFHITCIIVGCGSSETTLEDIKKNLNDTIFNDSSTTDTLYKDSIIKDTIIIDTVIHDTIIHDTVIHDSILVDTIIITKHYYKNPIIRTSLPDPTVIKADNGYFYLYATEDIRNTPIYKSKDLTNWKYVGTAFTNETRPQTIKGTTWAPDINYINGQYVMYYSKSGNGDLWACGIGVAISQSPEGPFHDLGKLFTSEEIGVKNSIDPFFINDNGHNYLLWGSQHGIYGIELSDDGLKLKGEKQLVAKISMEGTYVHYHDGYYYLFGSTGTCCKGLESTYNIIVARSENLFGPYKKKEGESQFEVFLKKNDFVVGPGHNAEFITDDEGQDWIIYHGYLISDLGGGRQTFLDPVYWKDGWPYMNSDAPSKIQAKPYFNK